MNAAHLRHQASLYGSVIGPLNHIRPCRWGNTPVRAIAIGCIHVRQHHSLCRQAPRRRPWRNHTRDVPARERSAAVALYRTWNLVRPLPDRLGSHRHDRRTVSGETA